MSCRSTSAEMPYELSGDMQATPTADTAMFYFQTNALGFTPEFLGRVRLAGSLASLAGIVPTSPHLPVSMQYVLACGTKRLAF